jgi:hypothetical protein
MLSQWVIDAGKAEGARTDASFFAENAAGRDVSGIGRRITTGHRTPGRGCRQVSVRRSAAPAPLPTEAALWNDKGFVWIKKRGLSKLTR